MTAYPISAWPLATLVLVLCLSLVLPATALHPVERLPAHMQGGRLYAELLEDYHASNARLGAWQPNTTVNYKKSRIDNLHGTTDDTYDQRFFYDLSFCRNSCNSTAPIFLELGGEWTVSASPAGAVAELAAQVGAVTVYLEHRFYGQSLNTTNRTLMIDYLSVEQAIADTAAFLPYFTQEVLNSTQLSRQWVLIGGSYAGALVSWFTVKHGGLLSATWSSSGVVNAIFNFTEFDQAVATAIGPRCSDAVRNVTAAFETYWDTKKSELLDLFSVSDPDFLTKADFAWMMADSAAMAPQYGKGNSLCKTLLPTDSATISDWTALEVFANWTMDTYGKGFAGCYYSTRCLSNETYADQWGDPTTWVYQCCSELAYWQIAYPNSLRSQELTTDYYMSQCQSAFGPQVYPDTEAFNAVYGGDRPRVATYSKVIATQGSDDPWRPAGVMETLSPNYIVATATCNGCSHCKDLHGSNATTDSRATTDQRATVFKQIKLWLGVANKDKSSSPLSTGAIVGIAAGSTVVVLALLVASFRRGGWCRRGPAGYSQV